METNKAADCLEALGNPTRLGIFRLLVLAGRGGLPVGRLGQELHVPASTLSHHISRLVRVGLVTQERQSRVLLCRAHYERINEVVDFLTHNCCQGIEEIEEGVETSVA